MPDNASDAAQAGTPAASSSADPMAGTLSAPRQVTMLSADDYPGSDVDMEMEVIDVDAPFHQPWQPPRKSQKNIHQWIGASNHDYLIPGEKEDNGRVRYYTRKVYQDLYKIGNTLELDKKASIFLSQDGHGLYLPKNLFHQKYRNEYVTIKKNSAYTKSGKIRLLKSQPKDIIKSVYDRTIENYNLTKDPFSDFSDFGTIRGPDGLRYRTFSRSTFGGPRPQRHLYRHPIQAGADNPDLLVRQRGDDGESHFITMWANREGIDTPAKAIAMFGEGNVWCKQITNAYVPLEHYNELVTPNPGAKLTPLDNAFRSYWNEDLRRVPSAGERAPANSAPEPRVISRKDNLMASNFRPDVPPPPRPPTDSEEDQGERERRRILKGKGRAIESAGHEDQEMDEDEEELQRPVEERTRARKRKRDQEQQRQQGNQEEGDEEEGILPNKRARTEPSARGGARGGGGRHKGSRGGATAGSSRDTNARRGGAISEPPDAILTELKALAAQFGGMREDIRGLTNRVEALETRQQERPLRQTNVTAGLSRQRENATAGPSRLPDRPPAGAGGNELDTREERFIRTGIESRKFDRQGQPFQRRTWSYQYTDVKNFPDGQGKIERVKELYRKGMRKSQSSGSYVFQPGSDLSAVREHIHIPADESISREGTPERDQAVHITPGEPQYFIVPQNNWAEAALDGTRIKVTTENLNIGQDLVTELSNNVKFIIKVDNANVDLNRFGMYPRLDIDTGIVYHPLNSGRSNQMDTHQTPKKVQDRNRGNDFGR